MIIPVRCHTCGQVVASKYEDFKEFKNQLSREQTILTGTPDNDIIEKSKASIEFFKSIGIKRYCCKRMILTHIDIIDKL
jgi:DNA-directed RNA polymerase subunit N (RpoN/RPB10)